MYIPSAFNIKPYVFRQHVITFVMALQIREFTPLSPNNRLVLVTDRQYHVCEVENEYVAL